MCKQKEFKMNKYNVKIEFKDSFGLNKVNVQLPADCEGDAKIKAWEIIDLTLDNRYMDTLKIEAIAI